MPEVNDTLSRFRAALADFQVSGQKYRTLFNTMAEGFLICEVGLGTEGERAESLILDANPAFERATGLSLARIQYLDPVALLPPLAGCIEGAMDDRARDREPQPRELIFGERSFEVRCFWLDSNQLVMGFTDSTGRREAEQRLARMNEELEGLVRERTLALEKALNALAGEVTQRQRQERLLAIRLKVLEQALGPADLEACLALLLEQVAEIFPDHPSAVVLLDPATDRLRVGATLGLPPSYHGSMDSLPDGPDVGCSPAACRSGRRVIADDLRTHPNWAGLQEMIRDTPLKACWAQPILAATGQVLGAFAIYAKTIGGPNAQDLELLEEAAGLAGLLLERKQGQRQRLKLTRAVEASPLGTIITDLDRTIEYANPRYLEITGYSAAEAVGAKPWALLGQAAIAPLDEMGETIRAGRVWRGEMPGSRKDGTPIWVKLAIAPVTDGQGVAQNFVGLLEDITERRQLEQSRAHLAAAVEQSAEAIAMLDPQGWILFANPACYRTLALVPEQTLGQAFVPLLAGLGGTGDLAQALEVAQGGQTWEGRVPALGRSGSTIQLEGSISPVRAADGRIDALVAVFRDVTRETDLDRRLRVAQKMDALGTLAGGIAHDFNNILSAILSAAELIEWQIEPDSPATTKLEVIYQAGQRARELIQQILAFSRRNEEKRMPFDFSAVVREVAALLRATLPENITVRTEISSSVWLLGDPGQLHQVLMNLAINGYHAMKDQGGVLSLGLTESGPWTDPSGTGTEAQPGAEAIGGGRQAVLTVADTGCGMGAETREKIFEPFFTTKPQGEGSGLGLSVVHGIVHQHGGSIQVVSAPGQGSRFEVSIPCQSHQPLALAASAGQTLEGGEHILFVDDEDLLTALTKEGLQALGYQVTAKTNGYDALEVFKARPDSFDLVVTDLAMPHLSGPELTRRLRKLRPDLPALLVTGAFQAPEGKLKLAVGFDEILNKPLSIKELALAIRRVMLGRRLRTPALGFVERAFARHESAAESDRPVVLLAEDSKVTRLLLRSWLVKGGYRVVEANDGQAAWEQFCAAGDPSAFSLVLTDLDMPRMGGLELVERVRAQNPELPVLLLTASDDMASLKQALQLHVDAYLNKPFDSHGLLEQVRRLISERSPGLATRQLTETAQAVRLAQRSMEALPEPDLPVFSLCEPLTDAGGDVFRCLQRPDGSVLLVLADVAGHSVISSYAVASFLGMLATFAQDCQGLVELFQRLNRNIQSGPFPETPIAVLAAQWDPRDGRLQVVNAGNPYGVWHRKQLGRTESIALRGMPLGLMERTRLTEKVLVLEPGDRVLFGTDGLFDTLSPDHVPFRDRVARHWEQTAGGSIQQALGAMCEAAREHGQGRITDDILVVGLEQPPWSPGPHELLRAFPGVAASMDQADRDLEQLLANHPGGLGLSRSGRFQLFLALHEALANAMEHGNGWDPGKRVVLGCRLDDDRVRVRVVDEGPGFDLAGYLPPVDPASERHRGIPILRHCTLDLGMRGGELEFHFDLKGACDDDQP